MDEKDHPHTHHQHDHSHASPSPREGGAHQAPVCGMTVKETTPHTCEYGGRRYFFCGGRCLEKFRAEPEKYLKPIDGHLGLDMPAHPSRSRVAREAGGYTCPMHPEVRRPGPGTCPV